MIIKAIKTKIITADTSFDDLLASALQSCSNRSILAVTSKVLAIIEGRIVKSEVTTMGDLVAQEASAFIPAEENAYGVFLSIKNNRLIPNAGIDQSNADGGFILLPAHPQDQAQAIRKQVTGNLELKDFGVIVTDSTTAPLRSGVNGICLAHAGFDALRDLIGQPDIYGRPLRFTKVNIADGLAAAAVLVMGESNEQTPMAIITELPDFVEFRAGSPTDEEIQELTIDPEKDLYSSLIKNGAWVTGKQGQSGRAPGQNRAIG